jgi:predicted alpha/beta hydrolase
MSTDPQYTQSFIERGGDRIGIRVYAEPEGVADAPVVVICPAMGVPAGYYRPFAAQLRAAGLAVVVWDLRGTGDSTPAPSRASAYGFAEVLADLDAVLAEVKPQLDGRKRILLGHSLGGQMATMHVALSGADDIDGLALIASSLPYWRAYPPPRRNALLPFSYAVSGTVKLLGVWPGWGFGGRQARGVIRDWAHTARTGRFPMIDGQDTEAAVRRIGLPVLAISVDNDSFTPHSAVDHLCAKFTSTTVQRERYGPARLGRRVDHFNWTRAAGPLVERIAAFVADLRYLSVRFNEHT